MLYQHEYTVNWNDVVAVFVPSDVVGIDPVNVIVWTPASLDNAVTQLIVFLSEEIVMNV